MDFIGIKKGVKMREEKQSEIISAFLKLLDDVPKEYKVACDFVNEKDKEAQDIMHEVELNQLKTNEKAKLMTELQNNRRERRYWKDKVDEYQPLNDYLNQSKEFKNIINQLKQILGKVRKAEKYLEERTYKPRIRKKESENEPIQSD